MLRILFIFISFSVVAQPNLSTVRIAPIPEPPVDGKTIVVSPSSDVKRVIETAQAGTTVKFNAGKYYLKAIHVPVKVNVDLGNAEVVATEPGGFNQVQAVFWFKSASKINGDQWIRGGTILGNNIAAGGIIIDGRDNIQISDTKFRDFNFFGLWLLNSSNGEARDLEFFNTSGATNSWASGELSFFNLSSWDIHHIKVSSNSPNKGYGLKAMYNKGTLINVRFYNITTDMSHQSVWNGGQSKNIGLEIEGTRIVGTVEIFNSHFGNQVSLAIGSPDQGKVIVRDCVFDTKGDTYALETILDNLEFRNSTIRNTQMITANFQRQPSRWKNWLIKDIKFEQPAGVPSWGGLFLIGHSGVQNVVIQNVTHPPVHTVVRYMDVQGGVTLK
jgi:hypothetical protein